MYQQIIVALAVLNKRWVNASVVRNQRVGTARSIKESLHHHEAQGYTLAVAYTLQQAGHRQADAPTIGQH